MECVCVFVCDRGHIHARSLCMCVVLFVGNSIEDCLSSHSQFRAKHGALPLKWRSHTHTHTHTQTHSHVMGD